MAHKPHPSALAEQYKPSIPGIQKSVICPSCNGAGRIKPPGKGRCQANVARQYSQAGQCERPALVVGGFCLVHSRQARRILEGG